MYETKHDGVLVELTNEDLNKVAGGAVFIPFAFYYAAVALGAASLGYQAGSDIARRR